MYSSRLLFTTATTTLARTNPSHLHPGIGQTDLNNNNNGTEIPSYLHLDIGQTPLDNNNNNNNNNSSSSSSAEEPIPPIRISTTTTTKTTTTKTTTTIQKNASHLHPNFKWTDLHNNSNNDGTEKPTTSVP